MVANAVGIAGEEMPNNKAVYTARLAAIVEVRDRVTTQQLKGQQRLALGTGKSPADLEQGNLVLLRRTPQDNRQGHKLESRWTSPYRLATIAKHGQSGWIEDLRSRQDIEKYSLSDLKRFVAWTEFNENLPGWQSVAAANKELRQTLLRPRRHQKQREQDVSEKERRERQTDLPSNG